MAKTRKKNTGDRKERVLNNVMRCKTPNCYVGEGCVRERDDDGGGEKEKVDLSKYYVIGKIM